VEWRRIGDRGVERIRIVVIDMPRMLRDIVKYTVSTDDQVELVREYTERTDLAAAVARDRPHFVIVGSEAFGSEQVAAALATSPKLSVLALTADGRKLHLHELTPTRLEFGEISPGRLLEVIRMRAAADDGRVEEVAGR
jgi:DNA-binding NarL/FixJ family response regulator